MLAIKDADPVLRSGLIQFLPQFNEFAIVEVGIADCAKIREFHIALRGLVDGKSGGVRDHAGGATVAGERNGRDQARSARHPGQVTTLFFDRKPLLRVVPHRIRGCGRVRHRAVTGVVRGYDDVSEFLRRRPRSFHRNFTPRKRVKKINDRPLSCRRERGRQIQRVALIAVRTAHNFGNYFAGRKWGGRDLRCQ